MTFTLYNDDSVLLIAEIADGNWYDDDRPVVYTGDTSLLTVAPASWTPSYLCGFFNLAAARHNLRMGGDFERFVLLR